MTANNPNNQPESLDDQIAAFLASIEAIKAKKLAIVSSLESEYAATIAHCKQTMDTMIKAGLDPRTLARDITALYAPSVTTTRATTTRTTATDGTKVNRKLNRPGPHTKGGKNWAICDDILQQNYGDLSKVTGAEVARRAEIAFGEIATNAKWHYGNWKKAQMIAISPAPIVEPYDCDFLKWTEETITHLQNRDFKQLDIANLIEEIDSLGKAQKNAFKGQIRALIEHIMKRYYVDMPLEYHGWERTIRNIRPEIEDLIEISPSLQNDYPQVLDTVYQQCLKKLQPEYKDTKFPDTWQFTRSLDDLLNLDFWE